MKLFNTLGRQLQDFTPINKSEVKLYTCGPTVYDYAHIGNLRSFVFDDTLRRALQSSGYRVRHVMNITDVGHLASDADEGEDKLEKGAKRERKTVWEVAERYITAFKEDMAKLNVLPPSAYKKGGEVYARATNFIPQQQEIVGLLLDKGYAYHTKQAIYFDVSKLGDYGKLTGQKLADKETGARSEVVVDKDKHHPQDFALWFFKTGRFAKHSMSWDSPWGEGFPGWHLECSAIIHAVLGEPIDIHTGGVDHIGTHHTNEIAQTEAAFNVDLARFWLHNEHLLVDNRKMAKSDGNFYTLKDITGRGFSPLALRLLFLQAHYRSQMNFTWEAMEAAQQFLNRLQAWADLKFQPNARTTGKIGYANDLKQIKEALQSDLNSSEALAILSGLASKSESDGVNPKEFAGLLAELDSLFGLALSERQDVDEQVKSLLALRQSARDSRDWAESDRLRDQLADLKIEVRDSERGQIWRRLN